MSESHQTARLDRRKAVARILRNRGNALVVASLGNPTYDVAAAGDVAQNFYLWGAMGGAVMLGFGLALAQPDRRVITFVGDGELMMGLGLLLFKIKNKKPHYIVKNNSTILKLPFSIN